MKKIYPATRPIVIPTPNPKKPNIVFTKPISNLLSDSHEANRTNKPLSSRSFLIRNGPENPLSNISKTNIPPSKLNKYKKEQKNQILRLNCPCETSRKKIYEEKARTDGKRNAEALRR